MQSKGIFSSRRLAVNSARSSMRCARRVISAREVTSLPSIEGLISSRRYSSRSNAWVATIAHICESSHGCERPVA